MKCSRSDAKTAARVSRFLGAASAVAIGALGCGSPTEEAGRIEPAASIVGKVTADADAHVLVKLSAQQSAPSSTMRLANSPAIVVAPPEVLIFGCRAFRDTPEGPICIPNPELKMSLWIGGHACSDVQLAEGGVPVPVETFDIGGGCRLPIDQSISQKSTSLVLSSRQSGSELGTIKLDCSQPKLFEKKFHILDRANADLYQAVADLQQQESLLAQPEKRIDTVYTGAQAYMRLGETDLAIKELRKVIEYAKEAGYSSLAAEAAFMLAYVLRVNGLLVEAKDMIAQAATFLPAHHAKGKISWHFHTGLVLREQMFLADAAQHLADARAYARQLDDRDSLAAVTPMLADLLVTLDRVADAENLLADFDLLLAGASDCEKAPILANKGWASLQLAVDEGLPGTPLYVKGQRIKDMFEKALQSRQLCVDQSHLANIYNGLAQTAFFENRFADSKSFMDMARKVKGLSAVGEMELVDLEGRLSVVSGRADDAQRLFTKLANLANNRQTFQRMFQCRAAVGQLESMHLKNQTDAATTDLARSCIQTKSDDLAPLDVRRFAYRLRLAGITQ